MLVSKKPNRCKHCRERMPEDKARHVLHEHCMDAWIAGQQAKQQRKREAKAKAEAKVERAEFRRRKEAAKRLPELIAEAQEAFNAYIRARDAGLPCICCSQPFEPMKPGGSVDAGHFRSRSTAGHLRFNEDNVFAQRKNCNRPGGTTYGAFRDGVVARIGEARVLALETDNRVRKWTHDEVRGIRDEYRQKLKELTP